MSKLLLLYNYKKYYNRIISKLETFQEYVNLITPSGDTPAAFRGFVRDNVNFDYQDGISAYHVINIKKEDPYYAKMEQPDYCVLEETNKDGNNIVKKITRYYVLEAVRTRGNQYELTLRRDLLADFYDDIIVAPTFIQRGNLPATDPLLFNKEGFTFNQIKKHELLLNFNKLSGKGKGWIVGYLNRESTLDDQNDIEAEGHIGTDVSASAIPDYDDLPTKVKNAISSGEAYSFRFPYLGINLIVGNEAVQSRYENRLRFSLNSGSYESTTEKISYNENYILRLLEYNSNDDSSRINEFLLNNIYKIDNRREKIYEDLEDWYASNYGNLSDRISSASLAAYDGRVFRGSDNKFYKIFFNYVEDNYVSENFKKSNLTANDTHAICRDINAMLNNISHNDDDVDYPYSYCNANAEVLRIEVRERHYEVVAEQVGYDEINCTIPTTRNQLLDAPYDMFCIPMGSVDVMNNLVKVISTWENIALPMARGIALNGTTLKVSDIQLLPYCPFPEMIDSDGNIDITTFTEGKDYNYITYPNPGHDPTKAGIILFPLTSRGTFDLVIPSSDEYHTSFANVSGNAIERKVRSETQFARFCSPNFASFFDINIQKNNGITLLNVDYFYKPYAPYIHVAPYFSGIYGEDFNDPKGLICSGDFSISAASGKWEEYQIQNKNYELIFNRQIENLDVNNAISMEQLKISSGLGVASSALQGMAAGAVAGGMAGPWGAAVGAVVGGATSGITSAVGRKYDIDFLTRQQKEARSYATDMYTYQLGNIKALPNTLTKVSSITENNKVFPFIEFYDCTDAEKQALLDKLYYNGMTVMRIGRIADYIQGEYNYVQGKLIRLTSIDDDNHVVAEIANELREGAYFYGSDSE